MSYPVDDTFVLHHVMLACRRLRLLITAALTGAVLAGIGAFCCLPVKYQISGVTLVDDPVSGSAPGIQVIEQMDLEQILCYEFDECSGFTGRKSVKSADAVGRVVDDIIVIDWRIVGADRGEFESFIKNIPLFSRQMQRRLPAYNWSFYVEPGYTVCSDFNLKLKWIIGFAALGGIAGLLLGFVAALVLICSDRSIDELRKFEQAYSISVLGVLPTVAGKSVGSSNKLMDNELYFSAVRSLMLNVKCVKPPAARAFVIAVCGMTSRCGTTSTVSNLGNVLQLAGSRVLLLTEDNCNMTAADQLAGRMEALLDHYAQSYDFIIMDLPDAQSSSVPLIVSKLADTMLLVCDCRNFSSYIFKVALWRFRKANIKLAGCVVNQFPVRKRRAEFDFYQQLFYSYQDK